jgi:hypothetical protein
MAYVTDWKRCSSVQFSNGEQWFCVHKSWGDYGVIQLLTLSVCSSYLVQSAILCFTCYWFELCGSIWSATEVLASLVYHLIVTISITNILVCSFTVPKISRICFRAVCMATFLLVSNEWRYQLFEELLAFASRGKAKCYSTHIKNVAVA